MVFVMKEVKPPSGNWVFGHKDEKKPLGGC